MKDHTGVFWVDTSIQFVNGNLSLYYETAIRTGGVITFLHTGHSIFAVTPTQMFEHLPLARDPRKIECLVATAFVAYPTRFVIDNILTWWVACALSRHCIESQYGRFCQFKDSYKDFADCSRYDQSALTLIIANLFGDVTTSVGPKIAGDIEPYDGIMRIVRGSNMNISPKTCDPMSI